MREDITDGRVDGGDAPDPSAHEAAAVDLGAVDPVALDLAAVFAALPGIELVLAPDAPRYTMLAATAGRLAATMTTREGTLGRPLFEVFPDANPANAQASGAGNLRASLDTVLRTRAPHRMPVQRYDLERPDGTWEERYWAPLNLPVLGPDGAVRYLIHRVEDITEAMRLAAEQERLVGAHAASERARRGAEDANATLTRERAALEAAHGQLQRQATALEHQTAALQATTFALGLRTEEAEALAGRLHVSEAHGRAVFAHAAVGMGRVGFDDARWRDVNDAFCRMLGYTREELLATPWPAITHPDDVDLDLVPFRRMAAGELDAYTVEKRFVHQRGHHVWVRLTLSLVRDAAGRPDYEVAVIEDITARQLAEAERERLLAAAEAARAEAEAARGAAEAANRAKSDFLAVMSHELRTPLNAIGGYAQLMELGLHGPVTPEQVTALGRIQHGQQHLLGLINSVLNYAKLEAGHVRYHPADVPVAALLAEVAALVAPQARAREVALTVAPGDAALVARADPEKVRQVLLNLLSNAIKFTRGGGTVTLGCARPRDSGPDAGWVRFTVADTGRGISADQLARVFEPFVQVDQRLTRTEEGTGLGLAISRDLARGMGGDLTAESTPGVGSTFTLTLPAAH